MSFSTELLGLMPSTIKISTRVSHNNYAEGTWSTSTSSYRCRIVERPGYIRGPDNEEIAYSHVIWARSTSTGTITVSDRVTLPDGTTPPVVGVERIPDENGPNHVKIRLGYLRQRK